MRIAVIGGGPGGLYFAYLWKKRHPDAEIDLFEQNAAGATWGFGVVFSEQALDFLRADDPETVDAITPRMESWKNITLNLRGESVEIDGVGFSSIGRLALLTILQERVRSTGVTPRFDTAVQSVDELKGYDLIVAADGLNSMVRRSNEAAFGASVAHSSNKFAWYGTTKPFATLSQTFVATEARQLQRPSLSLYEGHEHLPGRMRRGDLGGLRLRRQEHRGVAGDLRTGVRRDAGRPPADLEQIGVAQFPVDLERALVARQHGADRRRAAFGAFLDRLRARGWRSRTRSR